MDYLMDNTRKINHLLGNPVEPRKVLYRKSRRHRVAYHKHYPKILELSSSNIPDIEMSRHFIDIHGYRQNLSDFYSSPNFSVAYHGTNSANLDSIKKYGIRCNNLGKIYIASHPGPATYTASESLSMFGNYTATRYVDDLGVVRDSAMEKQVKGKVALIVLDISSLNLKLYPDDILWNENGGFDSECKVVCSSFITFTKVIPSANIATIIVDPPKSMYELPNY